MTTMILRGGDRLAMSDCSEHDGDVDRAARAMASEDAVTAEARVEALVTNAVQRWRLDDAIFWQRVMFKARLMRARRGIAPMPSGLKAGRPTC